MSKLKDLQGQTFGSWFVEEYDKSKSRWKVKCTCGNIGFVKSYTLTSGISTRCCKCRNQVVGKKNTTHGLTSHKLYGVWNTMNQRCSNPNNTKYHNYGHRGITVCDDWKDFRTFYNWALSNGYSEGLTIDRIDVNGNYEPNNCRWVTMKIQGSNTTKNHRIEFNGENHTITEWSEITGIQRKTLEHRLNKGWSIERTLTEKPFVGKNQTFKAGGYSD